MSLVLVFLLSCGLLHIVCEKTVWSKDKWTKMSVIRWNRIPFPWLVFGKKHHSQPPRWSCLDSSPGTIVSLSPSSDDSQTILDTLVFLCWCLCWCCFFSLQHPFLSLARSAWQIIADKVALLLCLQSQRISSFSWVPVMCSLVSVTLLSSFWILLLLELSQDFHRQKSPSSRGLSLWYHCMSHCTWHSAWNGGVEILYKLNKNIFISAVL